MTRYREAIRKDCNLLCTLGTWQGTITDISLTGFLAYVEGNIAEENHYSICIKFPNGTGEFKCRVVRRTQDKLARVISKKKHTLVELVALHFDYAGMNRRSKKLLSEFMEPSWKNGESTRDSLLKRWLR